MSEFLDENPENGIPEGEFPAPAPKQSRFSNTLFLTVVVLVVICSNAIAFALGMIVQQRNARPYQYVINTTNPDYDFVTGDEASVLAAAKAVNASVELRFSLATQGSAQTYASGVIVGARGLHPLILTNYHVVSRFIAGKHFSEAATPAVRLAGSPAWIENGTGEKLVSLLGYENVWLDNDPTGAGRNDLALLELKIDVLNLADCIPEWNFDPYLGERVLAVGNARGDGTSITDGVLSKVDFVAQTTTAAGAQEKFARYLVHSAAINQGNSGGALVDLGGKVIGINVSVPNVKEGSEIVRGVAYAIPAANALGFVNRVLASPAAVGDVARTGVYLAGESLTRATLMPLGITFESVPSASLVYEPARLEVRAITGASGDVRIGDAIIGFGSVGETKLSDTLFRPIGGGSYEYVYKRGARYPSALLIEEIAYRIEAKVADAPSLVIRVLRGGEEIDCVFDAFTLAAISTQNASNG